MFLLLITLLFYIMFTLKYYNCNLIFVFVIIIIIIIISSAKCKQAHK